MGDLIYRCPTVPKISGTDVVLSVLPTKIQQISDWPLARVTCGEITPDQLRVQWGMPTYGARYDDYSGFRLGNERNNLTLGLRTTYTNGNAPMARLEQQKVGIASLTLGGDYQFKYWNDHAFWWWPMVGQGSDQGDTAGVQFSYNLGRHDLRIGGWRADTFDLTLRLATGIPDPSSAEKTSKGRVYTRIEFPEVQRADLGASVTFHKGQVQRMEVGFTVDTGAVGDGVQNRGVHRPLGIPELPKDDKVEVMVFIKLTGN